MSVLPFPSFLDDIKEKGFKKALLEGVDEVVERFNAGMNIQDVREALRGEPASRKPNPRLQPHADGFWMHMRPSYFHKDMTGLYPTFRLGWLSTYFVWFETITGMLLMVWYTPSPQIAYGNMLNILSNVPLGQLMRDLHRLGAEAMVLIVWLHMLRTFVTGSYKKPRQFTWFTGVVLLIATMFLSFSGYLLPWDQLALWAVTIGASMVEATPPPIVGQTVNLLFRGGPDIAENGVLRFYLLHVLLVPAILFIFTGVHYYKVIIHGHSLPPQKENIGEDTAKRVPLDKRVYFTPDIVTSEWMWVGVTTFIMVLLCVWFYHAPLENHADPQVTPLGTTAPWYFLWIQGALKLGDKVFWGIIFPTLVIVLLMVYPYVDTQLSRRYAHRRFALSLAMVFISVMTVLSYMGLPEYGVNTSADTEVMHELTMEPAHNHMGRLRPVPFEQLAVGMYTTQQIPVNPADYEARVAEINAILAEQAAEGEIAVEGEAAGGPIVGEEAELPVFLGDGDLLLQHFASDVVKLPVNIIDFAPVPESAPRLLSVLEFFAEEIEHNSSELWNAWGAIVITEPQPNLRRLDVVLVWDEVVLENGRPVIDPATGHPLLTGNRRINSEHFFIHRNAEYFDRAQGG
jgi:ubiquinol-cytochrome c reductase cytochrome b subunit